MAQWPTSGAESCLSTQSESPPSSLKPFPPLISGVLFLIVFALLHVFWQNSRGTAVERLLIDTVTVKTAANLVVLLTPEVHATADGSRIRAPGGGLNILNGCEGIDVLFLLVAAFVAFPLPWRNRLLGLMAGAVFVFCLNQVRIVALFYAFRADKALFDLLHGTVAPVILITLTSLFFLAWTRGGIGQRSTLMPHA